MNLVVIGSAVCNSLSYSLIRSCQPVFGYPAHRVTSTRKMGYLLEKEENEQRGMEKRRRRGLAKKSKDKYEFDGKKCSQNCYKL